MFHPIPKPILKRMQLLERIDAQDRLDGTPHPQRLRQVSPESGKFLALLAANTPQGAFLEIGTSAGYSTLWLALAGRISGRSIITFEVLPEKAQLARETFQAAQVEDIISLVQGDALAAIQGYAEIAFCFLDAEKEVYDDCYEAVVPRLVSGGILVADNVLSHQEVLQPFVERAVADARVDALVVSIGKGMLVCRKV